MRLTDTKELNRIIKNALAEDIGKGDITTQAIIPKSKKSMARFIVKENGIICGLNIAEKVFQRLEPGIKWKSYFNDGDYIEAGTTLAEVTGRLRTLLTAERTALNFLQRLSGISTITKKYGDQLTGTNAKLLDTRKTVPGLRMLDKYAVKTGGGTNHRLGLFDMVLIKDNHIKAAGGIEIAVMQARKKLKKKYIVEVEVSSIEQFMQALNTSADVIMLDNMDLDQMKIAVEIARGKIKIEASGNITLDKIRHVAETGVDFISAGALTHSVRALDISMKIE